MRPYVAITGSLFGLLIVAHAFRLRVEPHLLRDPWFVGFTLPSAGFCGWAAFLLWRRKS